jgi:SAM-dependent methyltransferase/uncharacterized protein YbaR (Trm112 family)
MDIEFLRTLSCPYCRSALEVVSSSSDGSTAIDHGIVRCACYEYPIVDGILVLRQTSGPSDTIDPAVVELRAGSVERARTVLIERASMVPRSSDREGARRVPSVRATASGLRRRLGTVGHRLTRRSRQAVSTDEASTPIREDLDRLRPGGFADYLFQRYANPSFVAAVPVMAVLEAIESGEARPSATVLDLGCGAGHSTAMMKALFPSLSFVAADPDFVNLHLLRRQFADDATCICIDAELPLPFADRQFDAVFCLDAFHYIRAKWALARELDRVVDETGVWIFPHLHNAAVSNVSPGIPLRAEDYLRMFGSIDSFVLDEATVLRQFIDDHILDLTDVPRVHDLSGAPVFSLVGSRRVDVRRRYDIGRRMIGGGDRAELGVNPIYRVTREASTVRLDMAWPDPGLERECAAIRDHLPEHLDLEVAVWDRLRAGATEPEDEPIVAGLIETFVLVQLPPGYERLALDQRRRDG